MNRFSESHLPDYKTAAAKNANLNGHHRFLGLGASISFDHETAVSLANRFVDEDYFFLLESATAGPNNVARYSFFGFDPLWTFSWQDSQPGVLKVDCNGDSVDMDLQGLDPLRRMGSVMKRCAFGSVFSDQVKMASDVLDDFAGAVGYLSYDLANAFEPTVGKSPKKELGIPDLFYFIPRNLLVLDQLSQRLYVYRLFEVDETIDEQRFNAEQQELKNILKRLESIHLPPPLVKQAVEPDFDACHASMSKEKFFKAVDSCLEDIRAGEIFQVQIGNRLTCDTTARPFDVFRHLRSLNPSPYMFFFKFNRHHILGASPEMMVNVANGHILHRPIAGTRKRTWNPVKDDEMKHELTTSEKERAEHVMLVDLSRNDIGRIAAPGSVKVDELMIVEEYSHVFHMVSQVSGELAEGVDSWDAMVASFPNGTVSGAPKIRAMQIINQHEEIGREFYAGSLGLYDFGGNLKSTILIRTIYMKDGKASTQASAGIVYDSVPEEEWLETRNKMTACIIAIQGTE